MDPLKRNWTHAWVGGADKLLLGLILGCLLSEPALLAADPAEIVPPAPSYSSDNSVPVMTVLYFSQPATVPDAEQTPNPMPEASVCPAPDGGQGAPGSRYLSKPAQDSVEQTTNPAAARKAIVAPYGGQVVPVSPYSGVTTPPYRTWRPTPTLPAFVSPYGGQGAPAAGLYFSNPEGGPVAVGGEQTPNTALVRPAFVSPYGGQQALAGPNMSKPAANLAPAAARVEPNAAAVPWTDTVIYAPQAPNDVAATPSIERINSPGANSPAYGARKAPELLNLSETAESTASITPGAEQPPTAAAVPDAIARHGSANVPPPIIIGQSAAHDAIAPQGEANERPLSSIIGQSAAGAPSPPQEDKEGPTSAPSRELEGPVIGNAQLSEAASKGAGSEPIGQPSSPAAHQAESIPAYLPACEQGAHGQANNSEPDRGTAEVIPTNPPSPPMTTRSGSGVSPATGHDTVKAAATAAAPPLLKLPEKAGDHFAVCSESCTVQNSASPTKEERHAVGGGLGMTMLIPLTVATMVLGGAIIGIPLLFLLARPRYALPVQTIQLIDHSLRILKARFSVGTPIQEPGIRRQRIPPGGTVVPAERRGERVVMLQNELVRSILADNLGLRT